MHFVARLGFVAATLFALWACEEPKPEVAPIEQPIVETIQIEPLSIERAEQLKAFQQATTELPSGLVVCAESLLTLGKQFLDNVNAENLELVRTQWTGCQETYQASRALVGFTADHQSALEALHQNLGNKLEMPGYIDSVKGYPFSGIVNDSSLPLEAESLREQHGLTDKSDVSIGLDVIAFLLWGEQRYNAELPARSHDSFLQVSQWEDSRTDLPVSEHPNNRRRKLLQLTLQLALEDAQALQSTWIQSAQPNTETDADHWVQHQIKTFMLALEQQPNNEQLNSHVQSWVDQGVVPGVKPAPTKEDAPAEDLKQQLNSALQETPLQAAAN